MNEFLPKLAAFFRRDFMMNLRYGRGVWLLSFTLLFEVAGFFFLARAVGPGFRPEGMDYFSFLLVGTGVYGFFLAGMNSVITEVREAQVSGALEVFLNGTTQPGEWVALTAFSTLLRELIQLAVYLLIGFVMLSAPIQATNWLAVVCAAALSFLLALGLCMLVAAVQICLQKGSTLVWLFGALGWLVTGTTFPVSALPVPLQKVAEWIPLRHAIEAVRESLVHGRGLAASARTLAIIGIFALLLIPLAAGAVNAAVRHAQRRGTLAFS